MDSHAKTIFSCHLSKCIVNFSTNMSVQNVIKSYVNHTNLDDEFVCSRAIFLLRAPIIFIL